MKPCSFKFRSHCLANRIHFYLHVGVSQGINSTVGAAIAATHFVQAILLAWVKYAIRGIAKLAITERRISGRRSKRPSLGRGGVSVAQALTESPGLGSDGLRSIAPLMTQQRITRKRKKPRKSRALTRFASFWLGMAFPLRWPRRDSKTTPRNLRIYEEKARFRTMGLPQLFHILFHLERFRSHLAASMTVKSGTSCWLWHVA